MPGRKNHFWDGNTRRSKVRFAPPSRKRSRSARLLACKRSWSPVGTVQDRPRRQPRPRLRLAVANKPFSEKGKGVAVSLDVRLVFLVSCYVAALKTGRHCKVSAGFYFFSFPCAALPTPWSRLPARVLLPSGERLAPTKAAAETGAKRCPPDTSAQTDIQTPQKPTTSRQNWMQKEKREEDAP